MNSMAFKPKAAALAVVGLTIALVGSWLWIPSAPARAPMNQAQLNALAAQASQQGTRRRRDADPYRDEAVKNAIRQHALAIQKPWLAYLAGKPQKTEGAVTLGWTIAPDGKATQVTVLRSDFDNATFNDGVRTALAASVFPPPPGGQTHDVSHKLFFKQEPAAK